MWELPKVSIEDDHVYIGMIKSGKQERLEGSAQISQKSTSGC